MASRVNRVDLLIGVVNPYLQGQQNLTTELLSRVVSEHPLEVKEALGDISPKKLENLYAPVIARIEAQRATESEKVGETDEPAEAAKADETPTPEVVVGGNEASEGNEAADDKKVKEQPTEEDPNAPKEGTWKKWGTLITGVVGVLALLGSLFSSEEGSRGKSLIASIGGLLVGGSVLAQWPGISKLFGKLESKSEKPESESEDTEGGKKSPEPVLQGAGG